MTVNDSSNYTIEDSNQSNIRRAITLLLGGVMLIFLVGVLFGFGAKILEDQNFSLTSGLILTGIVVAIAAGATFMWKQLKARPAAQMANSERKSRNIYIASMAMGAALGIYIMATSGPDFDTIFSNGPISATTAIGALIGWLVLMPAITVLWWRTTDEHELKAYSDGALFAFHLYIFVAPSWWMMARAGWLPQHDPMIVFAIVMIVWSAVWLIRKYR